MNSNAIVVCIPTSKKADSLTDLHCPHCGVPELNPQTRLLNIRAYKVTDDHGYIWSHCLCCDNWF